MKKSDFQTRWQTLIDRHAYMFAGPTVGIQSSPRSKRLPYAIDIEPGWLDIVEQLCANIDAIVPADLKREDGTGFHVRQIKEKFGTLRFYWDVGIGPHEPIRIDLLSPAGGVLSLESTRTHREPWRDEVNRLIDLATQKTGKTCFVCAAPGRLRQDEVGWMYTSCDLHDGVRERFDS